MLRTKIIICKRKEVEPCNRLALHVINDDNLTLVGPHHAFINTDGIDNYFSKAQQAPTPQPKIN